MSISLSTIKPLGLSLLAASVLVACGGGSGGGSNSSASAPTSTTGPDSPTNATQLTMSCVDGSNYQCSGDTLISTENGVTLTRSGVQVVGRSTSDLRSDNPDKTTAIGLAPASGGLAEVRVGKASTGEVSNIALLLRNLGLSWDDTKERPLIIETFNPTRGRTVLTSSGAITSVPLPESSNLDFYDYARRGATGGTQANYANNRYFPRDNNPSRCPSGSSSCLSIETEGVQSERGTWRTGGTTFDMARAIRLHGDGDVHAGDAQPGQNGGVGWLEGGSGYGVPYPGSKGIRSVEHWSLQYSNLTTWLTQDTVSIFEWGGRDEHNKNRRGVVAFGDVTAPASVPTTGSVTYSGLAYGWYASNATEEPSFFQGDASVTVNFTTRQATISIQNTATTSSATPVPMTLSATTTMGSPNANTANYMTGPASSGMLAGGISGRYFGPVVEMGSSGRGPAEVGGAFTLSNSATGATGMGGFIARKR